jgi:anti-sigma regulatory factor (Ser/Thr protein kinase)
VARPNSYVRSQSMGERLHKAELPRSIQGPRAARQLIVAWFGDRLEADELETTTLLVSELVSNAVSHGEGRIELRADLDDDRLLVEVMDEGHGLERMIREREFEQVEGWGLKIVDAAAGRWGAHEGTTHVWFELERAGPRLGKEKKPSA